MLKNCLPTLPRASTKRNHTISGAKHKTSKQRLLVYFLPIAAKTDNRLPAGSSMANIYTCYFYRLLKNKNTPPQGFGEAGYL